MVGKMKSCAFPHPDPDDAEGLIPIKRRRRGKFKQCFNNVLSTMLALPGDGDPGIAKIASLGKNIFAVHGTRLLMGTLVGGHAWVEISNGKRKYVYDETSGWVYDKADYYSRFEAVPIHILTKMELCHLVSTSHHVGPYDDADVLAVRKKLKEKHKEKEA